MRSPFPFRCSFLLFAPRPLTQTAVRRIMQDDSQHHNTKLILCHSICFSPTSLPHAPNMLKKIKSTYR